MKGISRSMTLVTPEWVEAGCATFADVLTVFFKERQEADEKRLQNLPSREECQKNRVALKRQSTIVVSG